MIKILQKEAKILRKISELVPVEKISSYRIQKIISEMKEALASQDDGVAIAAPQIGYPLRIFVVSKKVENIMKQSRKAKEEKTKVPVDSKTQAATAPDMVFINPVIKKISREKIIVEEGCLSVRFLYGKVSRGSKVAILAYDEHGRKFERGGTGLLSQIFQHEVDHLNGILFIDKAKFVEEILPKNIKQKDGVRN